MKQTLIDKFGIAPETNLSTAVRLYQALLELPEEVIGREVDVFSHPVVSLEQNEIVSLRYTNVSDQSAFPVAFPEEAKKCFANGSQCSFEYKGRKYQIN